MIYAVEQTDAVAPAAERPEAARWAVRPDLLWRESLTGRLVLSCEGADVSLLDPMAIAVLGELSPPRTLDDLVDALDERFDHEASDHRADIEAFLDELVSRHIVARVHMVPPHVPRSVTAPAPPRPAPLRVLNLLNSDHRRGAETFGIDLADGLSAFGVDVETVAITGSSAAHTFPVPSLSSGRAGLAIATSRLVSRVPRCDVIVAHGGQTLFAAAVVHALRDTPFVYRVIGEPQLWGQRADQRARVRAALRRAARVAVYYEEIAAALVSTYAVDPERIVIIPKGAPTDRFPVVDATDVAAARQRFGVADRTGPLIVYLGALSPQKNVGQVIEGAARMHDATVLIVGDGPDRNRLEALAATVGADAVFAGTSDRPDDALLAADVVALTSRTEGMPSVLIEAGLAGRPVVTTKVGGIAHIVRAGETGIFVELDDVPGTTAALATAVVNRDDMGTAARRACLDQFDLSGVAAQWDQVLRDVAGRVHRTGGGSRR